MGRVVQPNNYFSQEDSFRGQSNNNSSLSSQTFEEVWSGNFLSGDRTSAHNNSSLSSNRSYDDVWSGFSLSGGNSNNDQDFNEDWFAGNSFGGGGSGSSNSTSFGSSNTSSSSTQQQSSTSRQSTQRPAGHSSRWCSTQWFIAIMNHNFKDNQYKLQVYNNMFLILPLACWNLNFLRGLVFKSTTLNQQTYNSSKKHNQLILQNSPSLVHCKYTLEKHSLLRVYLRRMILKKGTKCCVINFKAKEIDRGSKIDTSI